MQAEKGWLWSSGPRAEPSRHSFRRAEPHCFHPHPNGLSVQQVRSCLTFCGPGAATAVVGMIHRREGGGGGKEAWTVSLAWRQGPGSVGEACLRVPELPAASPSPQSCAQPGPTGIGAERPRGLLTRQAHREGRQSRGSEGNQQREVAGVMKAQLLCFTLCAGTVALSAWAKMMLLIAVSTTSWLDRFHPRATFPVYQALAPARPSPSLLLLGFLQIMSATVVYYVPSLC